MKQPFLRDDIIVVTNVMHNFDWRPAIRHNHVNITVTNTFKSVHNFLASDGYWMVTAYGRIIFSCIPGSFRL